MGNRMLLWHGSRLTNWMGILSQGLRIAPPEAPVTGYMFGKGLYFADVSSKSANYCCTSADNSTGIMVLSEVALGKMYDCFAAEYMEKPKAGCDSTRGVGRVHPDPAHTATLPDGVKVPLGPPVSQTIHNGGGYTALQYNEFIVYDVAQATIRYLLKLKFNYKK
jgi:poly [ADP-ribose] polymerase